MTDLDRIVVLAGGLSAEREVSLRSGSRVRDGLIAAGLDAVLVDADAGLLDQLRAFPPRAVFPAIHGSGGAGASIREIFHDLRGAGVVSLVVAGLALPLHVKPSRGGSALGASAAFTVADVSAALLGCFSYGDVALIEEYVMGTEVAVSVIDLGDGPQTLPAVEIVPGPSGYDYAARYTAGATEFYSPARLSSSAAADVAAAALTVHAALGLRDLSRADFIVDAAGTPYFLEVNVAPGMTDTSTLPLALTAGGRSLDATCLRLLEVAAKRGS